MGEGPQPLDLMSIRTMQDWQVKPSGTLGYNKAEVTLGGVDTVGLSSRTMEAKDVPGLYFVGEVVEVARTVAGDGCIGLGGDKVLLESTLVGQRVTLRFEGTLMHVVANGRLVKTMPAPLPPGQRAALRGARLCAVRGPPPSHCRHRHPRTGRCDAWRLTARSPSPANAYG